MKESKKIAKYLDLARELKTVIPTDTEPGDQKKNNDHPDHSTVKLFG